MVVITGYITVFIGVSVAVIDLQSMSKSLANVQTETRAQLPAPGQVVYEPSIITTCIEATELRENLTTLLMEADALIVPCTEKPKLRVSSRYETSEGVSGKVRLLLVVSGTVDKIIPPLGEVSLSKGQQPAALKRALNQLLKEHQKYYVGELQDVLKEALS